MDSKDDDIEKQMSLIENLFNYNESIVKQKINVNEESSVESLYNIIFEYYNDRIDYDSTYFDPYAYVNDMNENILESDNVNDMELLNHFNNYISKLIDGDITEVESIISVYKLIKFYYSERIIPESKYFDSYAFKNNLNEILDELDVSDMSETESESETDTESESETTSNVQIDPYLSRFINYSDNDDILLYKKSKNHINNLEKFINVNKFY